MAQEIIGFKLQIDGKEKVVNSLGEMKKLLKEANFELLAAQKNFGDYSSQAVSAAKKVADLKDSIQEAKETSDLFDPGKKFQAFTGVASAVAAGFASVKGAMSLVGIEGENVEKALLKVQSAMALSQGLSTLSDSVKDFKRLGAIIQATTVFQKANNAATIIAANVQKMFGAAVVGSGRAFTLLKGAIISTGIGALIVLLGTLISKIIDWASSTDTSKRAIELQNRALEEQNRILEKNRKNLQNAREDAILDAKIRGASAEEIFKINAKFSNQEAALNKKNLDDKRKLLNDYQKNLEQKTDENGKIIISGSEEQIAQYNKLADEFRQADNEYNESKRKGTIEAKNEELRIAEDGRNKSKQANDKAKALKEKQDEEEKKKREERVEAEKKADEDIRKAKQENYLASIKDENERAKKKLEIDLQNRYLEIDALDISENRKRELKLQAAISTQNELDLLAKEIADKQTEKDKEFIEKQKADLEETLQRTRERNDAIREATSTQEEIDLYNLQEQYRKRLEAVKGNEEAETALIKEYEERKRAIKEASLNQALDVTKQSLANISTIVGKETVAGKAIAITSATIDTYQAANKALKADYGVFGPAAQVARFIAVAATIGAGIKNVKEIAKAKVPGGGGGGVSVPASVTSAAPISPSSPQATMTQLDQGTINRLGSATNRSYVLESDVTNSQERIRRINRAARLN